MLNASDTGSELSKTILEINDLREFCHPDMGTGALTANPTLNWLAPPPLRALTLLTTFKSAIGCDSLRQGAIRSLAEGDF